MDQTVSGSEDTPRVLDSLPGCQYRMTSYDAADQPDLNPAYGVHLHDPRFLEYIGAPESVRLLNRAPDYWLHQMSMGPGYIGGSAVTARRWAHHVTLTPRQSARLLGRPPAEQFSRRSVRLGVGCLAFLVTVRWNIGRFSSIFGLRIFF